MGKFDNIKKMFQVGEKIFPAGSAAEALKIQEAMEKLGHISPGKSLVALDEVAPVANEMASDAGRGMIPKGAAAGIGLAGAMPTEESTSPFQMMKQGLSKYKESIVDPIANKAKSVLTPNINVGGQDYKTSSPVSDGIIEAASDPVNYVPGPAGAIAGAVEVAGDLTPESKFAQTRKMFGR